MSELLKTGYLYRFDCDLGVMFPLPSGTYSISSPADGPLEFTVNFTDKPKAQ